VAGVGLRVLGEAEHAEPGERAAADGRAVLPDAAGEHERVEALERDGERADGLGEPGGEDVERESARSSPAVAACSTARMSLLVPDRPSSPLAPLSAAVTASASRPATRPR
jgi:hypothetical protein